MSERRGSREEKTSESEIKRNSFAAKSESHFTQNNTFAERPNRMTKDRERYSNGYHDQRQREHKNYRPKVYRNNDYHRNDHQNRRPQQFHDNNWKYLEPNRRSTNRYTNSSTNKYPDQRQEHKPSHTEIPRRESETPQNDLTRKTERLSLNEDNERHSDSKCEVNVPSNSKSTANLYANRDSRPQQEHQDLQRKLDELTALKSIFDENVLNIDEKELKGRFLAEPVLNANKLTVCYKLIEHKNSKYNSRHHYRSRSEDHRSTCNNNQIEEFFVQHLPPIELYFELPYNYPSHSPPLFLISCKWLTLSQLDLICERLENLYHESRMEVLYAWFSFLQNEVLTFLGIEDKLDITDIINKQLSRRPPRNLLKPRLSRGFGKHDFRATSESISWQLIQHLKNYNEFKEKETFNKSYFTCNICFSFNLGEDCVVFPCGHINCKTCINGFFSTHIKEGSVSLLKCPETECQTKAPQHLVREVVSKELYERYERIVLDTLVSTTQDAFFCPRKACGAFVIGEPESSLAHCKTCGFAFCKNCKLTYHGFDPCNMFRDPKQLKAILERYQNGNAAERIKLETVYGKRHLNNAIDEMQTQKWLEDVAKKCPHCKASIEKSEGCNKMACWRCNTFFCWLCLTQLPVTQPYSHFSDRSSKCYNQLFQGAEINMDDFFEDEFD